MNDFSLKPFGAEIPLLGGRSSQPEAPARRKSLFPGGEKPKEISFRESMYNFVHDVDGMQKDAAGKVQDFMAGEISDVHDVMLAVEKAGTSFQLMMELRNKFLDAYQEIKRMPV
ncbi:MAG: flagellar hook-basal body complex protein FliE [Gemmatimonadota bacterium]|nr:flagellar hook-basal body complex protein FliE [Gemmatimonadota bacterium]